MTGTGLGYGSGSHANDINNAGLVVGARIMEQGAPERAVIWRNGAIRELGIFGGTAGRFGTESIAYGVNEAGHVVGAALPPSGPLHAFVWNGRRLRDLGTLGGNNEATTARDINDAGQITGYSPNADGRVDAFLWDRGVMRDLGVPTGATSSLGYGINNRGQVVGTAGFGEFLDPDAHARAVIWQDGVMTDLRTLVDDVPPGVNLLTGHAINDDGVIVGFTCIGTCYSDERRISGPAFMLVPKSPGASPHPAFSGARKAVHARILIESSPLRPAASGTGQWVVSVLQRTGRARPVRRARPLRCQEGVSGAG